MIQTDTLRTSLEEQDAENDLRKDSLFSQLIDQPRQPAY